jgi:hypothetical protein
LPVVDVTSLPRRYSMRSATVLLSSRIAGPSFWSRRAGSWVTGQVIEASGAIEFKSALGHKTDLLFAGWRRSGSDPPCEVAF